MARRGLVGNKWQATDDQLLLYEDLRREKVKVDEPIEVRRSRRVLMSSAGVSVEKVVPSEVC